MCRLNEAEKSIRLGGTISLEKLEMEWDIEERLTFSYCKKKT